MCSTCNSSPLGISFIVFRIKSRKSALHSQGRRHQCPHGGPGTLSGRSETNTPPIINISA
ncbi:hypothetical protein QC764_0083580 [Podospora pseudoanserina]|uniref:Uncharacterized protein n=1 Tax=Podospora pseudoanserina TaxID=2609844 RepID=A0ABR0I7U9_9PEZI|nr:hypothetical protein QC764_0083580 [Podospora pseudoanserina]